MTKLPMSPLSSEPAWPAKLLKDGGNVISNRPHMLAANSVTIAAIAVTNTGCWNCVPQPMRWPADLSPIRVTASSISENTTPAAVARKLARMRAGGASPWRTTDISLSDNTGSTHGIRLRIRPPRSATPIMAVLVANQVKVETGAPAAMVAARSIAWSPPANVSVTARPASVAPTGNAVLGVNENVARRPASASSSRGGSNAMAGSTSTNRSGATSGSVACATTSSVGCSLVPRAVTLSIVSPPSSPVRGTRA